MKPGALEGPTAFLTLFLVPVIAIIAWIGLDYPFESFLFLLVAPATAVGGITLARGGPLRHAATLGALSAAASILWVVALFGLWGGH